MVDDHRGVYETRVGRLPGILRGIVNDTPPFRLIRETNERSPVPSGTHQVTEFVLKHAGL